jgi:SP family arabinose:H+ symporter-like MFS transporter
MNKKFYLIFVCLISTLGGFLFGFDTAVISGTLSFVRSQFFMESMMEGWFVGSALLGCIIGVAFAGIAADRFGRKKTLFLSALLFLISAIGCMVSGNLTSLIIYRLIGGLGVGVASMLSPLYISEISPAAIRGRMVSLYQFAITIGILAAYFTNTWILQFGLDAGFAQDSFKYWIFTSEVWRGMFGSEMLPALAFVLLLVIVPESPRWLMIKNRESEAQEILNRIVDPVAAKTEISEIKKVVNQETASWKQLFAPGIRIALFIGVALAVLSQFSGINAIIYYGPRIFESAGFDVGGALNGQVIIGIVNVLFTLIAFWKIDNFGRRGLLLIGCFGMAVSHVIIGFLFYTGHTGGLLLLIFLPAFIAFFAFSYGPVVWTIIAEIYPTNVRGRAMSIATLSLWGGNYVIGQTVPWLLEHIKPYGTFWLFALMLLPAIWIVLKLTPETKGRTLEEIEEHWLNPGKAK